MMLVTGTSILTDHSDATLLQRQLLGLLRYLHVAAALFLDLFDVVAPLADDHAGRGIGHQDLHLERRRDCGNGNVKRRMRRRELAVL